MVRSPESIKHEDKATERQGKKYGRKEGRKDGRERSREGGIFKVRKYKRKRKMQ